MYTSSQISITETRGGFGATFSWVGMCDVSQIAVGRRDTLQHRYFTDDAFNGDVTTIRATSRWDIMPINVAACDILARIITR